MNTCKLTVIPFTNFGTNVISGKKNWVFALSVGEEIMTVVALFVLIQDQSVTDRRTVRNAQVVNPSRDHTCTRKAESQRSSQLEKE